MNASTGGRAEKGAVLIVGLILMLITTLLALTAMHGSTFQESMTSNMNNKAISFMAAEAGATAFWEWLKNGAETGSLAWENPDWRAEWQDRIPTTASGAANIGEFGYFWINPAQVSWHSAHVTVTVNGWAKAGAAGASLAETRLQVQFARPAGGVPPAFRAGLFSDQDITINGASNFTGSIHANGNVTNKSGDSTLNNRWGTDENGNPVEIKSVVSAHGSVDMKAGTPDAKQSGVDHINMSSASDYIEANKNNSGVIHECRIPSGDLGGAIYFCDGNATTSGDFSNVTIMAAGDVTHNGSAKLGGIGDKTLTVAIVAGGSITVNGSNETYGVFWADGTIRQNGSSTLGGSIVAGADIVRNGAFNYVQYDDFGTLPLPATEGTALSIQNWAELIE